MELQLDLPLLFIGDASMVLINVHSIQPCDEDVAPSDVEPEYYCHNLFKPSKVSPLHVVFSLKGVLAKQGKSFKPCTLIFVEWYRNLLINPYVISRPELLEFMQRRFQQFAMYIWIKCKPYKIPLFLNEMREYVDFNVNALRIFGHELC
jgi:hypothetical protein